MEEEMKLKKVLAVCFMALMLPISASAGTIVQNGHLADYEFDLWLVKLVGSTLTVKAESSSVDTVLYVFDNDWKGLKKNDDASSLTTNSLIVTNLAAGGVYYVGVSNYGINPLSNSGQIFPSAGGTGVVGPTGPGGSQPFNGDTTWYYPLAGNYKLTFSDVSIAEETVFGAAVPEPATLTLLGTGLLGLSRRAWKRRQVKEQIA
jgi:hypothetical protein